MEPKRLKDQTMNIKDPILEHKKEAKLKNGTEVTVKGFVFDHPVFEQGDPPVYNMVTVVDKNKMVIGIAFFAIPMTKEELIDKVDNVSENPDDYLAPHVKMQMNN